MGIRRVAAGACAVAGVAVLTGLGWALLTAAALMFIAPPAPALVRVWDQLRVDGRRAWRWLAGGGRRTVAIASLPAAVILLPVGVGLIAGLGWAVFSGAVSLGGVSLLAGQNA
jgi:hypothetical protein